MSVGPRLTEAQRAAIVHDYVHRPADKVFVIAGDHGVGTSIVGYLARTRGAPLRRPDLSKAACERRRA